MEKIKMQQIKINEGKFIPKLESGFYIARLVKDNKIIMSLTPTSKIIERLGFRYRINKGSIFKQIYDINKGALESFIIEGVFKLDER